MIEQFAIGVCGLLSVWFSQSRWPRTQRWACVFGMIAQPFWIYATIKAGQWGIFALSIVYTIGWARGVHNFWIKPKAWGRAT